MAGPKLRSARDSKYCRKKGDWIELPVRLRAGFLKFKLALRSLLHGYGSVAAWYRFWLTRRLKAAPNERHIVATLWYYAAY